MTKKLILLDRDGVINKDSPNHIRTPDEWRPIEDSLEAISKIKEHNHLVAVVTNQSGINRGYYSLDTLNKIHAKMNSYLAKNNNCKFDHIFFCPHHPDDNCDCRKPKPGMILQAMKHFNISCEQTYFVGDSFRDIEAALAANCKPILVLTGNGKKTLESRKEKLKNVSVFDNLTDFASNFLQAEGVLL